MHSVSLGQLVQRHLGPGSVHLSLLSGIFQPAKVVNKRHDAGNIVIGRFDEREELADGLALSLRRNLQRTDEGKGNLPLPEVVPGGLTGDVLRPCVV